MTAAVISPSPCRRVQPDRLRCQPRGAADVAHSGVPPKTRPLQQTAVAASFEDRTCHMQTQQKPARKARKDQRACEPFRAGTSGKTTSGKPLTAKNISRTSPSKTPSNPAVCSGSPASGAVPNISFMPTMTTTPGALTSCGFVQPTTENAIANLNALPSRRPRSLAGEAELQRQEAIRISARSRALWRAARRFLEDHVP